MRIVGDCREVLKDLPKGSVQMCVTSPPYWGLRDYGVKRQIGLEKTPEEFVATMVEVFRLVRDVLADDGTLWLNFGDSYASTGAAAPANQGKRHSMGSAASTFRGSSSYVHQAMANTAVSGLKPKDLMGMPWRVAFALQADGWYLRSDIIWHKPNPMPESVRDRPTKSHEYVFLLSKSPSYFCDMEAIREPAQYGFRPTTGNMFARVGSATKDPERTNSTTSGGDGGTRNRRTVWTIPTSPYPGAHFATFPPKLVEPCILAGTSEKGHCPECGARWERVVEREGETTTEKRKALGHSAKRGAGGAKVTQNLDYAGGHGNNIRVITTLGFRPTCECYRKPVPDVILDPFFGAGTVGLVAQQLGRDYIGVELNPRYSKLAREAA